MSLENQQNHSEALVQHNFIVNLDDELFTPFSVTRFVVDKFVRPHRNLHQDKNQLYQEYKKYCIILDYTLWPKRKFFDFLSEFDIQPSKFGTVSLYQVSHERLLDIALNNWTNLSGPFSV